MAELLHQLKNIYIPFFLQVLQYYWESTLVEAVKLTVSSDTPTEVYKVTDITLNVNISKYWASQEKREKLSATNYGRYIWYLRTFFRTILENHCSNKTKPMLTTGSCLYYLLGVAWIEYWRNRQTVDDKSPALKRWLQYVHEGSLLLWQQPKKQLKCISTQLIIINF